MGLSSKVAAALRDKLDELGRMRIGNKPLGELTDAELRDELERRRRRRGYAAPEPERGEAERAPDARPAPGWKVRQWYRNLELRPGASREEVEEAYRRLLRKYDPDRYEDGEKRRAAVKLAAGLGEAYYGLIDHFEGG